MHCFNTDKLMTSSMSILRIALYYANFETRNNLFVNKSKESCWAAPLVQPRVGGTKINPVTFRGGLAIICTSLVTGKAGSRDFCTYSCKDLENSV